MISRVRRLLPLRFQYGRGFQAAWRQIQSSLLWTEQEIRDWQFRQVKDLVEYAYRKTRYYRELLDRHKLPPEKITTWDHFREIPFLTKKALQERMEDIRSVDIPENRTYYVTTGGSTGVPVGFHLEKSSDPAHWAHEWFHWARTGHTYGDRVAILRGFVLKENEIAGHGHPVERDALLLSVYHLTPERFDEYLDRLRRCNPTMIRGYPSALDILANHILTVGKAPREMFPALRRISTSSETLYPSQRERIEKAFGVTVFDKYGNCERTGIIGMGPAGKLYHDFVTYAYTETVDEAGQVVHGPGRIGEIVGTAFLSRAMPFIRYKTDDFLEWSDEPAEFHPRCRWPTVRRVLGRKQEMLVSKHGNLISMTAINFHSDVFDNVHRFRFLQETPGRTILRVVRKSEYDPARDDARILHAVREKIGPQVDVSLEYVQDIPLSRSGKSSFLEQKLDLSRYSWTDPEGTSG